MNVQVMQYLTPKQRSEFEKNKNTRRQGRVQLRTRLWNLVVSILPQTNVREKGAAPDASQ